jgi:hypothetical protein
VTAERAATATPEKRQNAGVARWPGNPRDVHDETILGIHAELLAHARRVGLERTGTAEQVLLAPHSSARWPVLSHRGLAGSPRPIGGLVDAPSEDARLAAGPRVLNQLPVVPREDEVSVT